MKTSNSPHFGPEELDAFHDESLDVHSKFHLETCTQCQELVEADVALFRSIEQLPLLSPSEGFADRVMASVKREPEVVPIFSFPTLTRNARRWGAGLAAMLILSVSWSVANRNIIDSWISSAREQSHQIGVQLSAQSMAWVSSQTAFDLSQINLAAPSSIAVMLIGTLSYLVAIVAFRRLVWSSNHSVGRGNP